MLNYLIMKISFILFIHMRVKANFIFYMNIFLLQLIKADILILYECTLYQIWSYASFVCIKMQGRERKTL